MQLGIGGKIEEVSLWTGNEKNEGGFIYFDNQPIKVSQIASIFEYYVGKRNFEDHQGWVAHAATSDMEPTYEYKQQFVISAGQDKVYIQDKGFGDYDRRLD
jgi:hypothetical protein